MTEMERLVELIDSVRSDGIPDGAFTTTQLVETTGRSRDWCDRLLRDAIALGLAEWCGDILLTNRIGRPHSTPHYKFIDAKKKNPPKNK